MEVVAIEVAAPTEIEAVAAARAATVHVAGARRLTRLCVNILAPGHARGLALMTRQRVYVWLKIVL